MITVLTGGPRPEISSQHELIAAMAAALLGGVEAVDEVGSGGLASQRPGSSGTSSSDTADGRTGTAAGGLDCRARSSADSQPAAGRGPASRLGARGGSLRGHLGSIGCGLACSGGSTAGSLGGFRSSILCRGRLLAGFTADGLGEQLVGLLHPSDCSCGVQQRAGRSLVVLHPSARRMVMQLPLPARAGADLGDRRDATSTQTRGTARPSRFSCPARRPTAVEKPGPCWADGRHS